MKELLKDLNKAFENKIRLGIMSALVVNEYMDFNSLKELLDITDGNLASHIKTLENHGFLSVKKEFIGKKPNTKYYITRGGKMTFKKHIGAIEQLLK